jgi:DNA-binding NtrC family response regulator
MNNFKILVVDDEPKLTDHICAYLSEEGYHVTSCTSYHDAITQLNQSTFHLIITDLRLSVEDGQSGIDLIRYARNRYKEIKSILISAYASLESGVDALDAGAVEILTKPLRLHRLLEIVNRIQSEDSPIAILDKSTPAIFDDIVVGALDSPMRSIYELLPRVVKSDSTILIRGESGTGKEVIARAIHKFSLRKNKPFIQVNCAAIVETLLESELFGIEEKVATGVKARPGKFEQAEGGILFLDEIGDMSPSTQTKVLRSLQEKEITRVGGSKTIKVDVRLIAATHQNLEEAIKEHRFREDLYYRLNVISLQLPPLRARPDDIPFYVHHFLKKHSSKSTINITQRAIQTLIAYNWPGNVRELENTIERAIALTASDIIDLHDLPANILNHDLPEVIPNILKPIIEPTPTEQSLENMEKSAIIQVLNQTNWNQTKASKLLGITRRKLGYKIEKFGLRKT